MDKEHIVQEYGAMVSSICRRMIQDREVARDAAQEVWLEVVKSLPTYKGMSKVSTWIYSIAQRVILRYTGKERMYSTKFLRGYFRDSDEPIDVPDEYETKKRYVKEMCDSCLVGVLHCLTNEARIAYIMRDIARLPYDVIAEVLNKDGVSTRKNISRSRKKLQNFLNEECVLYNSSGNCKCRMKKHVKEINLDKEYNRLKGTVRKVRFFYETGELIPAINYWEEYLTKK